MQLFRVISARASTEAEEVTEDEASSPDGSCKYVRKEKNNSFPPSLLRQRLAADTSRKGLQRDSTLRFFVVTYYA